MGGGRLLHIRDVLLPSMRGYGIARLHLCLQWDLRIGCWYHQGRGRALSCYLFLFLFWGSLGLLESWFFLLDWGRGGGGSQRRGILPLSCPWVPQYCFKGVEYCIVDVVYWYCLGFLRGCLIWKLEYCPGTDFTLPFLRSIFILLWLLVWVLSSSLGWVVFLCFIRNGKWCMGYYYGREM